MRSAFLFVSSGAAACKATARCWKDAGALQSTALIVEIVMADITQQETTPQQVTTAPLAQTATATADASSTAGATASAEASATTTEVATEAPVGNSDVVDPNAQPTDNFKQMQAVIDQDLVQDIQDTIDDLQEQYPDRETQLAGLVEEIRTLIEDNDLTDLFNKNAKKIEYIAQRIRDKNVTKAQDFPLIIVQLNKILEEYPVLYRTAMMTFLKPTVYREVLQRLKARPSGGAEYSISEKTSISLVQRLITNLKEHLRSLREPFSIYMRNMVWLSAYYGEHFAEFGKVIMELASQLPDEQKAAILEQVNAKKEEQAATNEAALGPRQRRQKALSGTN